MAALSKSLTDAEDFNTDAKNECRMYNTEWHSGVFENVLTVAHQLHSDLAGIEICMTEEFKRPGKKNDLLIKLLRAKGLPNIGLLLESRVAVIRDLIDFFLWSQEGKWPGSNDPELMNMHKNS